MTRLLRILDTVLTVGNAGPFPDACEPFPSYLTVIIITPFLALFNQIPDVVIVHVHIQYMSSHFNGELCQQCVPRVQGVDEKLFRAMVRELFGKM